MGCFSSKHTTTVSTTTTHTQSTTVGGRTVANVSSTTHTTPSRGKPTTTHDSYQTVTYHGTQATAQPVPGVVRDPGLPTPTPLEEYIRPTWAFDALAAMKLWQAVTDDIRRKPQNAKRGWELERFDGDRAVVYTNGVAWSDTFPVVKIATLTPPRPKKRFSKKEAEPLRFRWSWADEKEGDKDAIKLCGETNGIHQLTEPEYALEPVADLNLILQAALRATDLPYFLVSPADPKRSGPQDVYLLRGVDEAKDAMRGGWSRAPTLKDLDGDTYRALMVQGRVVEKGVLKRHGAAAPECLQALAEKMGWEFYDLGSWYAELQGKEHIGMRDPRMNAEWAVGTEYDIVNGKRESYSVITYKAPGLTGEYTRSFVEW